MSTTRDVVVGLAGLLNDAAVGIYRPTGSYASSDTAIVFGDLPPLPNRAIGITAYASDDEVDQSDSAIRVQFWVRGNPNDSLDAGDIQDAIFDALQNRQRLTFGSVYVALIYRQSYIPVGMDQARRSEISSNYILETNPPSSARRPD